jgi:hypothetical protein
MAHAPNRARRQDSVGEYTHICLDKQLPCLYPFPQRSQRSSARARFPSPLTRCEPSLARRFRLLVGTGLEAGSDPSTAGPLVELGEALRAAGESRVGLFILRERYEPKPGVGPTELDSRPFRPLAPRRWWEAVGMLADSPPVSFMLAAATAAAALLAAAVVVTLLRRVTRWFELTAPREMEWEWCLGLD